jgi:catalase
VLDRNPANHFAEVEQAAFAPSNLVRGIGLSPDKMLMGRIFSYHDTHLHRVGPNYQQLPINAPRSPVHSYSKDGAMTFRHAGDQPVYAPNSYGGPRADPASEPPTWWVEAGELGRYAYERHADDDDFVQPRALYRDVMSDTDRAHLVTNIVAHASDGVSDDVRRRVIAYWTDVDPELGARVDSGLHRGNGRGALARARDALRGS